MARKSNAAIKERNRIEIIIAVANLSVEGENR
jgi:hypothetical protein